MGRPAGSKNKQPVDKAVSFDEEKQPVDEAVIVVKNNCLNLLNLGLLSIVGKGTFEVTDDQLLKNAPLKHAEKLGMITIKRT